MKSATFGTVHDVPRRAAFSARELGRRIVALRAEQGLTQEKLAWEAGLSSKGYLSRIERGERLPSLDILAKLAQRLGVDVRDLFIVPGRSEVDDAMERLRAEGGHFAGQVLRIRKGRAGR